MTKARTKAQKRRGRPRKENAPRTESGQISRAKDPINKVALDARMRLHGVSAEDAGNQEAATYLGRLHMAFLRWKKRGEDKPQPEYCLSTAQYYGILQYQELHNDWLKAIGAPGAYYEPHLGGSGDEAAHEQWAASVKERFTKARNAIQEEQNNDRAHNLWATLDLCVLREQEMPHMMGSLRTLGNTLARHFRWG